MDKVFPPAPEGTQPVPGFPTLAASPDGTVFKLHTRWRKPAWQPVTPPVPTSTAKGAGYLRLGVQVDGIQHCLLIHRAVAMAFLGPAPFPGALVRHLNDLKTDNRVANLAWGDFVDNLDDAIRNGTKKVGAASHYAKLSEEDAREIHRRRTAGEPSKSIAKDYPVTHAQVDSITRGKTWKHLGLPPRKARKSRTPKTLPPCPNP